MKACATCGQCYEDDDLCCAAPGHKPLRFVCPGTRLIAGNYFLSRFIGSGGTGAVFAATDLANGHDVAIKVLLPSFLATPSIIRQFRKQGYVAQRLLHPNIAATYRCGILFDDIPYTVMELLEGTNLRTSLLGHGPLPLEAALDIAAQSAAGLNAAHRQNIIHRDLTPANIVLIRGDSGRFTCKLVDFGLCTSGAASDPAEPLLGTPRYMAPEQYARACVDGRTDLFSLGVILYELLAGKPPFPGPTPREVVRQQREPLTPLRAQCPELPGRLEALVTRALSFDPAHRVQTAASFECELRHIQRDSDLAMPPKYPWTLQQRLLPSAIADDETIKSEAEVTAHIEAPAEAIAPRLLAKQRRPRLSRPFFISHAAALLLAIVPTWLPTDQSIQRPPSVNRSAVAATKPSIESPVTLGPTDGASVRDDEQTARLALTSALADWIAATNAQDFERQAKFYPPVMEAFYLRRRVSRKAVLAEKRRLFAEADVIDIRVQAPTISLDQDGLTAQMRFNKQYVIEGSHEHRAGKVLQELRWVKSGGSWQIVSERDLRVIS